MRDYIAWLNGTSVARGTESQVRDAAKKLAASERWQQTVTGRGRDTVLRITRGPKQLFVSSVILYHGKENCNHARPSGRS